MPSLGSWITIGHPAVAEIMAAAGFDWLTVDLEHSAISIERAEEIIRIIELSGVKPFVRLSSHNPEQIKRVMDSGAHGIIVPMVKTAAEVTQAIAAVHYPPLGNRSVGLARAQKYGNAFEAYYNWQESNVMVIVQIEHIDAVDNIEAIFSVQGISGYIVGPYDLSASMGIPGDFANKKMSVALDRIKIAAKDHQVPSGIHIVEPDLGELKQRISEGYKFIAYGVDMRMLDITCRLATGQMKDLP